MPAPGDFADDRIGLSVLFLGEVVGKIIGLDLSDIEDSDDPSVPAVWNALRKDIEDFPIMITLPEELIDVVAAAVGSAIVDDDDGADTAGVVLPLLVFLDRFDDD